MAISGERVYLIPYYHHFLRSGTLPVGTITSPVDPEGEWLRQGIIYTAGEHRWVVLAVRNATREGMISLIQRSQLSGTKITGTVLLTLRVSPGVPEAAEKLGIALYQFDAEPKLPPIPCSTCGARLDPTKPPWRCARCAPRFTGEYRLVICHRCALPFRTVPNVAHRLADHLKETGVWNNDLLCPDCRTAALPSPLLDFDGTLRGVILWALLRGHVKLENLIQMGLPTTYVNEEIRPTFVQLLVATRKKGQPAPRIVPKPLIAVAKVQTAQETEATAHPVAVGEISTAVGGALGLRDAAGVIRRHIELEIDSIEEAFRTGERRRVEEDTETYLARVRTMPTPIGPVEVSTLLDAVESALLEAYGALHEEDAPRFLEEEETVVKRFRQITQVPEEPEESALAYLLRLRGSISGPPSAG